MIVWRRRSRRGQSHRRESAGHDSPGGVINLHPQITVTPFNSMGPTLTGAAQLHAGSQTGQQQWLVYGPSSSEGSPLPSPRVLSESVPVGMSSKELAQLRSRSQPTDGHLLNPSPTITTDRGAATSSSRAEDQRLHWQSEVESLRREMQQLRTERFEAPPSYASEDRPA